ncbi:Tetratricopeptide repeat-containing protein [Andreprevotia lacus DSM 23236]|jgi:tetratricopeptide (TPR) repeat protein|uniref:Tetratricopeptide repeat-containing protein n=1 Tax=Andreprevotia lacus DSM 23236 TaxID=1121001 RepID=A0A1W1XY86_9NEIS|nr:tetratricopeptide repeat protein [Andreprevotia lacus]SMC28919.1 Tetratricopeptide repeat-containing protein [Andreprevotia lacus DSM 23236]
MSVLPAILHDQIVALLDAGDRLFERGDDDGALKKYREAEALLPSERQPWEASTLVLIAIGDTLFQKRDFAAAAEVLLDALDCAGGEENPFVHLRLGQCAYELGERDSALESFKEALALGGNDIFEDEDDIYLGLLRDIQR